ncbi:MAG: hypothetical protein Q9159_003464 [Coniocarpon cinnabarinum]
MLISLYPQKWLPYRYLWPFLWNWWDNYTALKSIATQSQPPKVLLMTAEQDEVVPSYHGEELLGLAKATGLEVNYVSAPKALHHEVMDRREGKAAGENDTPQSWLFIRHPQESWELLMPGENFSAECLAGKVWAATTPESVGLYLYPAQEGQESCCRMRIIHRGEEQELLGARTRTRTTTTDTDSFLLQGMLPSHLPLSIFFALFVDVMVQYLRYLDSRPKCGPHSSVGGIELHGHGGDVVSPRSPSGLPQMLYDGATLIVGNNPVQAELKIPYRPSHPSSRFQLSIAGQIVLQASFTPNHQHLRKYSDKAVCCWQGDAKLSTVQAGAHLPIWIILRHRDVQGRSLILHKTLGRQHRELDADDSAPKESVASRVISLPPEWSAIKTNVFNMHEEHFYGSVTSCSFQTTFREQQETMRQLQTQFGSLHGCGYHTFQGLLPAHVPLDQVFALFVDIAIDISEQLFANRAIPVPGEGTSHSPHTQTTQQPGEYPAGADSSKQSHILCQIPNITSRANTTSPPPTWKNDHSAMSTLTDMWRRTKSKVTEAGNLEHHQPRVARSERLVNLTGQLPHQNPSDQAHNESRSQIGKRETRSSEGGESVITLSDEPSARESEELSHRSSELETSRNLLPNLDEPVLHQHRPLIQAPVHPTGQPHEEPPQSRCSRKPKRPRKWAATDGRPPMQ